MDFGPSGIANDEAAYLGPVTADAGGLIQWIDPSKILAPSMSASIVQGRIRIMTALDDFDRLLKQTMGLDIASIGASALGARRAGASARMQRGRHPGVPGSRSRIQGRAAGADRDHRRTRDLVLSETARRLPRSFASFAKNGCPTHADGCLRLLSLPCSTGEEPYSMAMALLDAHVPPSRFRIDAIDICGRSLAHARRGIYGKGSFRGDVTAYRERYFEPVAGGHALSDAVRPQVNFQQGNLLQRRVSARCGYLRRRLLPQSADLFRPGDAGPAPSSVLDRLLTPKGILFAGSSESGVFVNHAFSSAKLPMAFAFRKGRPVATPKPPAAVTTIRHLAARRPIASVGSSSASR